MAPNEGNLIAIDLPKSEFEDFLESENNKRIFFSGKFGIGKTFFLQRFFELNSERYDTYHLFPARYQASSNENIVELIKYDLLVEFLKQHPNALQEKEVRGIKGFYEVFAAFYKDKGSVNGLLKSTLVAAEEISTLAPDPVSQALSKLGRPLVDLLSFDKEFQEFKKEYLKGEKGVVEAFLREIVSEKDAIGTDYLSQLVSNKIEEAKGDKKSVFIFDDFDRIDPEHVFRLLNVLSAHIEHEDQNRFGFDHIIIVGDIRNLRSVFHHRYGAEADFWGYFDKFFTVKPYEFDNNKAVSDSIPFLLQQIKHGDPNLESALGESGIIKGLLQEVLSRAFAQKKLTLRQLYKPINHQFPELRKGIYNKSPFANSRSQCIDIALRLLTALYGGKDELIKLLEGLKNSADPTDLQSQWFYDLYASCMLSQMLRLKPGERKMWQDKYLIIAKQDPSHSNRIEVTLDSETAAHPVYFYDVLVAYVKESHFENKKRHNYEY